MESVNKGIKDFEVFKESPYTLLGVESRNRVSVAKGQVVSDTSTGELYDMRKLAKTETVEVDTLSYTKVYHNSLESVSEFSIPALKIWCFILQAIKPTKYAFEINFKEAMEFSGYKSIPNIYKGIVELLDKGFIAKSVGRNMFFLNPNYYFNGDRLKNYNKINE